MSRSNFLQAIDRVPARTLVLAIVALHMALTGWQAWFMQINDDGVLYVRAARLFVDGRFLEGRAIYSWFGFPFVIAAVSKITTLDALIAGKLVNFLASTGTLLLLLRMSWTQLPSKAALCAVAILTFGNYWWNDERGAIVRDQLFFFFVILSFYCLLRDSARPQLVNKLGFAVACICASLFRVEAAALLVMVPALLLASGPRPRTLRVMAFVTWLLAATAIILAIAYQTSGQSFSNLFGAPINRIAVVRDQILAPFASRKALLAYNWMIAGLVVSGILASLSPLALALTAWGAARSAAFRRRYFMRLLVCYGAATFLVLAAQTYFSIVFEPRYGLAVGLLMTIPAAIAATTLIPTPMPQGRRATILTALAVAWLGYGLFGGMKLTDASRFHLAAGQWLRENVAPNAKSLSNNNQIAFYGNLAAADADNDFFVRSVSGSENISKIRNWANYDVVVIRLRQNQLGQVPGLNAAIGRDPSKEFVNSRGDKILIYQPRKPTS